MSFVNTEYFSPVIKHGITRAPKGHYEYHEWYKREVSRCLHGYSVGGVTITGNHYWYLNWWKIRGRAKGAKYKTLIAPRFLDVDFEFFWEFENARNDHQHFMCAKRRQVGATEKVASIIGHEFTFKEASQSVIVAGEEKYSVNATKFVLRGLNSLSGTEFYQQTNPGDDGGIVARYKARGPNGNWTWKGRMAELHWFTARNNPQVVSSKSPSLILFEECGVFDNLIKTFGYVSPSLEDQGQIVSTAVFLGTGGETEGDSTDFGDIFYNPETWKIRSYPNEYDEDPRAGRIAYFIPGWKYLKIDDEGNSLKEESIKHIQEERDAAIEANNNDKLLEITIARPMNPDEIFLIIKGNRFPQAKLNRQNANLKKYKHLSEKHTRVKIDFTYDGIPTSGMPNGNITGVKWELDPEGVFHIFEFPELGEDGSPKPNCFAGTDSYDKDRAPTSSSKGSCSIFDGRRMKYVARVTERPETAPMFYEMTAKLCLMYGCRNLIEWSNIRIFDWYEKHGLTHLLKERPDLATANLINSQVDNKYGVDPATKNTWLNLYKDYMVAHCENMTDSYQIDRALHWKENDPKYNCDVTISSSLAQMHYADELTYIPDETEGKTAAEKVEFLYYKSNGGVLQNNYNIHNRN